MAEQARQASERFVEVERMRAGAIQEVAYYRSKVAALEANNEQEIQRVEQGRVKELETHISELMSEQWAQDRKVNELNDSLALQTILYEQAEARATEATKHADKISDMHNRTTGLYDDLLQKHDILDVKLRDHQDRLVSQSSLLEQREAEELSLRAQLGELTESREQHIRALDQTRIALQAASSRADEVNMQYQRAREQINRLENDLVEVRGEIELRTLESETARGRLTDAENSWAKSREEVDGFRALTTGTLGQLLDLHRDLKADEDRHLRGHSEKLQAVEAEAQSLRMMLRDVSQRVDESTAKLNDERRRNREHETENSALMSQIVVLRGQLSNALSDVARLRKDIAEKENHIRDKVKDAADVTSKMAMLRNYLAENGIGIDEDDLGPSSRSNSISSPEAIQDLENKLAERTRLHEIAERELAQTLRRKRDAEAQVNELSTQLDQVRTTQSPANNAETDARLQEAEEKLEETEKHYEKRIQQLEEDYQLAVHYVK
jgi:chromosome segregation ATPase